MKHAVSGRAMPGADWFYPNSSLGEKLQEMLPDARVVKTLNTCNTSVQTNPSVIGPSSIFLSGEDTDAKGEAAGLLRDLGWPEDSIVDLGGISPAKGPEHYFIMFASFIQALGTPTFNIRLVH